MRPGSSPDAACGCCDVFPANSLPRAWRPGRPSRRAFLASAVASPASAALAGGRPDYPSLREPLVVQQVPGSAIHFTIGHPGVPSAANEGHTSNAGFVITGEGVVVFDTLGTSSLGWALLDSIRKTTDEPIRYVILSHYHADHIYGLQAFRDHTDAEIIAQVRAFDYTAAGNIDDEQAEPRLAQRREALAPWVNARTRIVEPRLAFQTAAEIRLGRHDLQITYAGPAHSMSDSMMFVLPDRVLFSGDIVQNGRIPYMASAAVNTDNWLRGLQEVTALRPRFIIPGHGQPSQDALEAIAFTRDYILYLRQVMERAVEDWAEFDQAYERADWSRYEGLPAFDASNRGNAYRVFLESQQKSFAR